MNSTETSSAIPKSEQSGGHDDDSFHLLSLPELPSCTDDDDSFPFFSLPAELRQMVYRHVLVFAQPVHLKRKRVLSFYKKHVENCPLNRHVYMEPGSSYPERRFTCKSPFNVDPIEYGIPDSVLTLLGVCRLMYLEAAPVFYRGNHFAFSERNSMPEIADFLDGIGDRFIHLRELSFVFGSRRTKEVFTTLADCLALEKLHIYMNIDSPDVRKARIWHNPSFEDAPAILHMFKIRGLKELELAGKDRIGSELVDINHPEAIGPILKQRMLAPKETRKAKAKRIGVTR